MRLGTRESWYVWDVRPGGNLTLRMDWLPPGSSYKGTNGVTVRMCVVSEDELRRGAVWGVETPNPFGPVVKAAVEG